MADVRPLSTLRPGECYAVLADRRLERRRLAPFAPAKRPSSGGTAGQSVDLRSGSEGANSGRAKHEERHCDEHGLILRVQPTGGKSWVQRVTVRGKRIVVGLGGYPTVTLKEARETALANRRMARQGVDPRKARKTAPTFRAVAEAVIAVNAETWRGGMDGKSAGQWLASLNDYAYPVLGSMAVDAVTTADVLRVVKPIWNEKRETASRVRQRISAIMRYKA